MLEIVAVTDNVESNDALIYEVFDHYNNYYHIEKIHKKCLIFKTECIGVYLYLFPFLPEDEQIQKNIVHVSILERGEITLQETPIGVYPKIVDLNFDFFEFIECDFHMKILINELVIEKARYICSNLQIDIKKREKEEENFTIVLHNSLKKYKDNNINVLDPDSIWEKEFLSFLPKNISEKYKCLGYTCLEIECEMKNKNLEQYEIIKSNSNALYTICCLHETDYSVSKLFCEIFRLSFVCSDYEKKNIKTFMNHKWYPSDGGICIKRAISSEFPKKLLSLASKFTELKEIVERICFMIQNQSFRNKIFSDCCEILYDEYFSNKINSKKELISFNNGVYDTKTNQLRPGIPSDYLIFSTRIPYKVFDMNSLVMKELTDFLNKVFPVKNIMKYFVRFLSSCLERGNKDKIFSIWSGPGDNGKSVLVNLISLAFGEYSVKLPTSLISGKRSQSASATPELTMIEGTLISFLQEPDETERMNAGIVKELTGNDHLYVRPMYGPGKNIRIDSKFVLIANQIPQLGIADKAAWNRIKVIPFLSTFVDDLDLKEKNKDNFLFKKDLNFSQKLPHLAPALMYLLTKEYKCYKLHGLEEPEEIQKYTQDLKTVNDPLEQFIKSSIESDSKSSESIKEMYETYKSWFKNMFPTSKVMNMSNFYRELKKRDFIINSLDQVLGIKIVE
jgi:P4 family phage/plasmid primase-like protien